LNIEEALRGGRVGIVKLYHECNLFENEKIHYYDVCSMMPKDLHIPNLPCKIENKLLFPLCYTCAKEKLNLCPNHTDAERAIEGVYISEELKMAVNDGYKIMEIYEVWDFETQYDKDTKLGGMFTKYINMFLKGKNINYLNLYREARSKWLAGKRENY
jgi:hypothetical protein